MKILSGVTVAALVAVAAICGVTAAQAQGCDHGGTHTITVQPDGSEGASLTYRGGSGDSVRVCPGDSISWVLTGSDRTFFVDFFSGAPFAGATRRGNNTRLTITVDAAPGSYNYDIGFDGSPGMDPVIIVE
jgi:plastocyanin